MQNRVRNANLKRLRRLIKEGVTVEAISQAMSITVEALTPFMPKQAEKAPPKKSAAKKRVVKKKAVTDGKSD